MSPAMAVHMGERFKLQNVQNEISRLVRSNPKAVVDVPEALHFLLGDRLDATSRSLLKVSCAYSIALTPVASRLGSDHRNRTPLDGRRLHPLFPDPGAGGRDQPLAGVHGDRGGAASVSSEG